MLCFIRPRHLIVLDRASFYFLRLKTKTLKKKINPYLGENVIQPCWISFYNIFMPFNEPFNNDNFNMLHEANVEKLIAHNKISHNTTE